MTKIEKYFERLAEKDFRCDLEPMRRVCELFNNPQVQYPTVHIVGTNGKGSTAAFLESILREAGLKTGLITSPHLVDLTERIQINRESINSKTLDALVEKVRPRLPEENFLSFFEMITLLGFLYFSEQKVDIAIIEAGMGGRLDATNLLKPKLILVTPISLDHQNYLGETLTQIAL
ncbi:MAG: hypothetical protein HY877_05945 [Deltaproteobacteria bacterium]|nr:hypothetical protein [Deltaproteobacteria bacterium]